MSLPARRAADRPAHRGRIRAPATRSLRSGDRPRARAGGARGVPRCVRRGAARGQLLPRHDARRPVPAPPEAPGDRSPRPPRERPDGGPRGRARRLSPSPPLAWAPVAGEQHPCPRARRGQGARAGAGRPGHSAR